MRSYVHCLACLIIPLATLFTFAGCERQTQPSNPEFEKLLQTSVEELQQKTTANTAWGLGKFDRWDLNQDVGDLVFSNKDGTTTVCPAQIIGSYYTVGKTWEWAWNNPNVADKLKADSLKVKAYGQSNHIARLTKGMWSCEESDAWEMTALAAKLCHSQGAYRGPAGSIHVFMTFSDVKLSKTQNDAAGILPFEFLLSKTAPICYPAVINEQYGPE